jgi:hypothetical protein
LRLERQQRVETLREDFDLGVAVKKLQTDEVRAFGPTEASKGSRGSEARELLPVREHIDEVSQQPRVVAADETDRGETPKPGGGVFRAAPDRLPLYVADSREKDFRVRMLEPGERLHDRGSREHPLSFEKFDEKSIEPRSSPESGW